MTADTVRERPSGEDDGIRRRLGAKRLAEAKGVRGVACLVGDSPSSVKRWSDFLQAGGPEALKAKPHPGRRPFLSLRQKERLRRSG